MVASSRRSVSQGAVQKTAGGKIKKARREEAREHLWENLTKGRSTHFYRPPTETRNMTAGLWFSVVNLSLKHAHRIFQTSSLEWKANI